jgi:two-component system chemotaxis sensor kinase CheA
MIDVGHYLQHAFEDWFGTKEALAFGEGNSQSILLIDDSPFFRNMLKPLLEVAGYAVTVAADAKEALQLRESGQAFDCIISDIEMPGMNGFELAQTIRSEGPWRETPIVALSSHATPKDFERGRSAGFTDYVAKFDRDGLIHALQETLHNGEIAA